MLLQVENELRGTTFFIEIKGTLDYSTIEMFNEKTALPQNISAMVIDFSAMEFTDSTGIGAIIGLIYASNEQGVSIEFHGLSPELKELFDTIGVFRVMEALRKGGI
jgi:anti-anti-sigma factor